MAKQEFSKYQQDVIKNYYDNLDTIMLNKLGDTVTDLFLADSQAKKDKLWERAHKAMMSLGVPEPIIAHILAKKDVQILAKNLNDWLAKANKKK